VPDLVYSVDISNDGNLVAVGSRGDNRENLTVFDVNQDAKVWTAGEGSWVWDVAFSPDQRWLVSGSDSGLQVWDARGGVAPAVLLPPTLTFPEVKHLSISSRGNFLQHLEEARSSFGISQIASSFAIFHRPEELPWCFLQTKNGCGL